MTGCEHDPRDLGSTETGAENFWVIAKKLSSMTERQRISGIRSGFEVDWLFAAKAAFGLDDSAIARFADISIRTLRQRLKGRILLSSTASERVDRLAQLTVNAENVFETRSAARDWMIIPNDALGGSAPLYLCKTEIGGRQVRRALHATEWGSVV
ncbi:MAG: DUF2384 domain-containing protein [Pseudomonas sp.]|nr:DUF2384 domain-containing protein [Pseudomonas sp.]